LVEVFLTNGNGVAWGAELIYRELIEKFDSKQAFIAIMSFINDIIFSRLQFPLCQQKYREILEMMRVKITLPAIKELIDDIENSPDLSTLRTDKKFRQRVSNRATILKIKIPSL
jgi:hypothetical protein